MGDDYIQQRMQEMLQDRALHGGAENKWTDFLKKNKLNPSKKETTAKYREYLKTLDQPKKVKKTPAYSRRLPNPWLDFLRKIRAEKPGITMTEAKALYKKKPTKPKKAIKRVYVKKYKGLTKKEASKLKKEDLRVMYNNLLLKQGGEEDDTFEFDF